MRLFQCLREKLSGVSKNVTESYRRVKNLKKIMNNYILELKAPDFRRGFAADLYSAIEEAATNKKTEKSPDEKKPKKAQKKKKGRVIFST